MTDTKARPELTLKRKVCSVCGKREFELTSETPESNHTCMLCS